MESCEAEVKATGMDVWLLAFTGEGRNNRGCQPQKQLQQ